MSSYRLTDASRRDLRQLRIYLLRTAGEHIADHVEDRLFEEFDELARLPQLGHRHPRIADPNLLTQTVWEYLILFRRQPELRILRVIHGRRDLPHRL